MATVNSTIALAGKPPVLPEFDPAKLYLTLGQLKFLAANAAKVQGEEARTQTKFAEAGAVQKLLSTATRPPVPQAAPQGRPPAQVSGAPQPGTQSSTEPVVTGEVGDYAQDSPQPHSPGSPTTQAPARQRTILDPDLQAEIRATAPHGAQDLIDKELSTYTTMLGARATLFENVARTLVHATDEASYQTWRASALRQLPEDVGSRLPTTYPGEGGIATLVQGAKGLKERFDEQIKLGTLAVAQQSADTAQAAEARAGTHLTHLPTVSGPPIAMRTFGDPTPLPAPGTLPAGVVTVPQAEQANAHRDGWMRSPQNQTFLEAKQAHRQMQDAGALNTAAGDRALIYGYSKVIDPKSSVSEGDITTVRGMGTLSQRAQGELSRLFSSGTPLSPEVRTELLAAAKKVHDGQIAQHKQMRRHMLDFVKSQRLPNAETAIPDLSEDEPAAASPAAAKRSVTRADLKEMARRADMTEAQMEKIITDAKGKIVP